MSPEADWPPDDAGLFGIWHIPRTKALRDVEVEDAAEWDDYVDAEELVRS